MLPFVTLQYKEGRGLKELSENLSLEFSKLIKLIFELSEESLVRVVCLENQEKGRDVKDLEITLFLHNFLGNKANLVRYKDAILKGVRKFLSDYDRDVSGIIFLTDFPTTVHGRL